MKTEIAAKEAFDAIRYAQCWEDADILLDALDVRPGDVCLSICSAGDNSLALLARDPASVVALDLSPAQLACLEIRVAALRTLDHPAFLELYGARPSTRRAELYARCRDAIPSDAARAFWDARQDDLVAEGFAALGKLERYMGLFRRFVLPLIHGRDDVRALLTPRDPAARREFYEKRWNTWRWRLLFRLFFSRFAMARLGRSPAFFDYVEGSVADHLLARTAHAMADLDPSANPYLTWILTGGYGDTLPFALRAENFDVIRGRLDRLEWHLASIEDYLDHHAARGRFVHRFNLSDVFEYMSEENQRRLLERVAAAAAPGARLAYWNMMVPRSRPADMADRLRSLPDRSSDLHARDRAFFYRAFVVEEAV